MNTWPSTLLPDPLVEYEADQRTSVIRTAMDSGRFRQRKRFSTDIKMISAIWSFTELQYTIFQSFHRYKLSLGADFFFIDLWFGEGPTQVKARFVQGAYSQVFRDGRWIVSGTLEVEEQPTMDEGTLDLLIEAGAGGVDAIEDSSDSLHELVHVTLPANE